MAKHIVFNDIDHLITMVHEQNKLIQAYEAKIPQIEIDILMSNIRRLYEDLMELNRLNQNYKPVLPADPSLDLLPETDPDNLVRIVEDPPVPEKEAPPVVTEPAAVEEVVVETPPETMETIVETNPLPELPPDPQKPYEPPQKKSGKKTAAVDLFAETESNTVADKFRNQPQSYNDKISGDKKDKTLADTLLKPIADLRTGIGVNDRFVFINELFGGSMSDYQTAIEEINRQPDLANAQRILSELKTALLWKDNSDGLKRLQVFVARRFA